MFIDQLKDDELRSRMIATRDGMLSPDNPALKPEAADWMTEITRNNDMICLPRDSTVIDINQSVKSEGSMILPSEIVEHFIRNASCRVLMNFCICRESKQCKDYPVEIGCIFLGDTAREIHPELGREVGVDEALEYARRGKKAGLVYSVGKNKLDTVWLGLGGDDARLLTICHCCPCCCLIPSIPYLREKLSGMPGVNVTVDDDCTGCGACIDKCMFGAIDMKDDRAEISDECRGCTRCLDACPEKAIKVTIDDRGYVENIINRISQKVNYR